MITLFYGAAALALVWWLSKTFTGANPAVLAKAVKMVGGVAALGAAALLLFRGRFDMAFLVGGAAAWLLGWSGLPIPGFGSRTAKRPGAVSRVRSAMVEMELDHDTGDMGGSVLAGAYAGRSLASLSELELKLLYDECLRADGDGVRLLEAYLDRRFAGWREHAEGDRDARPVGDAPPGAMTEQEAYEILGLQPGAGVDEIRQAHRALMKKLHPDQGGSTYLAARVNRAKEILLGRHR
jgi:hypothetical protein